MNSLYDCLLDNFPPDKRIIERQIDTHRETTSIEVEAPDFG